MNKRWSLRMKYISRIETEYNKRSDLIPIIEDLITDVQNLTKHNNDFKKVCQHCKGTGKVYHPRHTHQSYPCQFCNGTGKPISKS